MQFTKANAHHIYTNLNSICLKLMSRRWDEQDAEQFPAQMKGLYIYQHTSQRKRPHPGAKTSGKWP